MIEYAIVDDMIAYPVASCLACERTNACDTRARQRKVVLQRKMRLFILNKKKISSFYIHLTAIITDPGGCYDVTTLCSREPGVTSSAVATKVLLPSPVSYAYAGATSRRAPRALDYVFAVGHMLSRLLLSDKGGLFGRRYTDERDETVYRGTPHSVLLHGIQKKSHTWNPPAFFRHSADV